MRRIDRYIVANVASSMLLVMAVVLSLDLVFAFVAEMEELRNDYQIFEAIVYVMTTLPRRIYDYLPLGAFMGCLVGLGSLAKSSELVVLRAAGVSTSRIVISALKPALVVILVAGLLGEYVAPYTEKIAQSQRAVLQGAQANIAVKRGLWHREGGTFMHFNAVEPNGVLHGVSLHEFNDSRELTVSRFARRAIFQRGQWVLENVQETRFESGQTVTEELPFYIWETELSPRLLSVLIVKPDNLSVSGLYSYANYLEQQGVDASQYLMAFWKKTLQPLSTIVLVLVAISFVFGPLRSVTMGFRVFSGVVIGLLFKYMQDLLGPSSLVFGFNPVFATLVPVALCAVVGLYLLKRAN